MRLRLLLATLLVIFGSQLCLGQSAPEVSKVEPPGWWANHSINPVRVLIRGKNLLGARVVSANAGLVAGQPKVSGAGTYLFVDVSVARLARPGKRALRITTPQGTVDASFEIYEPLARAGRFQGFTTDDVMYLIMTDRFSDGDPSNDDPPESKGLFDRARARYYHGGDFQGLINHLSYLK